MFRITIFGTALILLVAIFAVNSADAAPILQLYLEGGTYNDQTESWELTAPGSSSGVPFRLWAIGNVDGPGGKGTISNVRISAAYDESYAGLLNINFTPATTGGYGGFIDPSTPIPVVQNGLDPSLDPATDLLTSGGIFDPDDDIFDGIVEDGSVPVLGDGKPLPSHGIFGEGTVWEEFALGDFTLSDSPIADFIYDFPTSMKLDSGQINVYDVSITGGHGATVHFDLYDSVHSATDGKFAPFSHDGEGPSHDGTKHVAPEPAALVIWSLLGLFGLVAAYRKRGR